MANKKRKTAKKTKKQKLQQEKMMYFFIGFAFVLIGLFGSLHLGFLGNLIANVFRVLVGNTYQLLGVLLIALGVVVMLKGKKFSINHPKRLIGGLLVYLAILLFLQASLFHNGITTDTNVMKLTWEKILQDVKLGMIRSSVGGGMIGALLYSGSYFLVDQFGTYLLVVTLATIGLLLLFDKGIEEVGGFMLSIKEVIQQWLSKGAAKQEARRQQKEARLALKQQKKVQQAENSVRPLTAEELKEQAALEIVTTEKPQQTALEIDAYQATPDMPQPISATNVNPSDKTEQEEGQLDFEIPQEVENRDYQLPPTTILDAIPASDQSGEKERVQENVDILEKTFKSFGVDAKVVRASIGPSVTKYEIQPAVGVKVSKIVNLTDDLALALAAKDIRMEAPIPGKSLIGIEVPNSKISMVSFRDVVEAQTLDADKLLDVPLGRDISGQVISADLTKMPHLLIAGSTGSGKSVCINGIITSILMHAKPHEVKMMMIDPKMVELNVYNGVPHLLTPVVTNPRKAAQALQKVVQEMEKRYELFAGFGVRNITGYNELIVKHNLEDGENRPVLPFIVVIVDELADLMMVASNEVEDAITRLAQMARAAGIHMILATQRPSVDVITGIIKANVPSRIAFAVSSGTDSRTIIDSNGAEKLLGRGDMLFLPMGENKPIRVQGAFISDGEVENIVDFVTEQQQAEYQEEMMPSDEPTTATGESQDDLYKEAVEMIVEMETASISMLQRRFRIGYNRAARLIDEMEANGVVGPSEGSKPRKVLLSPLAISEEHSLEDTTQ